MMLLKIGPRTKSLSTVFISWSAVPPIENGELFSSADQKSGDCGIGLTLSLAYPGR